MVIVYISKINGAQWSGPSHSVPAQIDYQAKEDTVVWINLGKEENAVWSNLPYYYNREKISYKKISALMEPFNKPDLVIVEQFYAFTTESVFYYLIKEQVPYIIIPRGEFTEAAQAQKHAKKIVANKLIMNRYMKGACAIQYLTDRERDESKICRKYPGIVIPNGTEKKAHLRHYISSSKLCLTYIGRIDVYHKGLDMLIQACELIKSKLFQNSVFINIYGPDRDGRLNEIKDLVRVSGLSKVISFYDAVVNSEKEQVLLNTDVFLMTSRFEGLPMALIEALSYGVPCAVTDGTNMRDEIENENAGWGCHNDIKSIRDMLSRIIEEKNLICEKGKNAYRLSEKYIWENIAKRSHLEYEKIIRSEKC